MTTDLTLVRFAGAAQGFNWLPVFVAEDQRLFEKHGLKIDYLRLGSVDKVTAAVREGDADLAISPPEGAIADHIAGGDLHIIAANALRLPMSLVARPGIDTITALRGKRIGTSSLTEGTAIYIKVMLQQVGLSYPGDYDFALAGVHTARWTALQNGEIDCAPQPAPWNFLAERSGYQLIGEVNSVIPEVVFAAVIAGAGWVARNRDTVARLVAALREAHEIVNDPARDDITRPIYQRITTRDEAELAARGFTYTRDMGMWPRDLKVTPAALRVSIDLMVRAGLLAAEHRDAATGVLDPTFVEAV